MQMFFQATQSKPLDVFFMYHNVMPNWCISELFGSLLKRSQALSNN